jgi:hypothetical protein
LENRQTQLAERYGARIRDWKAKAGK